MALGALDVTVGGQVWTVTVVDEATDPVVAPAPLWRDLGTSLDYRGSSCGGPDRFSVDHVRYRLCGEAVLYLAATGTVPPSDDLSTVELLAASDEDTLDLAEALGAGEGFTGTVWLGAMDSTGRAAWADGDTFTMPEDDHVVGVEAVGADIGGESTTPDAPECTAFEGWGPEDLQRCPTRDGSPDCRPVSGCSTTAQSAPALAVALGLLATLGRRRVGGSVARGRPPRR